MPNIIDNIKVGILVDKLLKDNNYSIDLLSKYLKLSKKSINKNLKGINTFDMLSLIKIAKLFNIPLSDIIVLENKEVTNEKTSIYEEIVKDQNSFKKTQITDMDISKVDIFGKVLVEWVIEYNRIDIFNFIHNSDLSVVEDSDPRAAIIYANLINFALKNKVKDLDKYFDTYVRLFGELNFPLEFEEEIWKSLNENNNQNLVKKLSTEKVTVEEKNIFGKIVKREYNYLNKNTFLELVSKYKLENIFKWINGNYLFTSHYFYIVNLFLKNDFHFGIVHYIKNLPIEITANQKKVAKAQDALYLISNSRVLDTFKIALKKDLILEATKLLSHLIVDSNQEFYLYFINNYPELVENFIVSKIATRYEKLDIVKILRKNLTKDELDFLLSITNVDDFHLQEYLITEGAEFNIEFYNKNSIEKINKIINKLLERSK